MDVIKSHRLTTSIRKFTVATNGRHRCADFERIVQILQLLSRDPPYYNIFINKTVQNKLLTEILYLYHQSSTILTMVRVVAYESLGDVSNN